MDLSYSLKNLRRLTSVEPIEIRPITILVGMNSVGKSTFLRSFPLLRQSIETKSSAPILWYGDFVDFGNFQSAVSDKEISKKIEFSFILKDISSSYSEEPVYISHVPRYRRRRIPIKINEIRVNYGISGASDKTVRSFIEIETPEDDSKLKIYFENGQHFSSKLMVDEFELSKKMKNIEFFFNENNIFSNFILYKKENEDTGRLSYIDLISAFREQIENEVKNYVFDKRISDDRIRDECKRILRFKKLDEASLNSLQRASTKVFRDIYSGMNFGNFPELRENLNNFCKSFHILSYYSSVSEILSDYFRGVEYIGPARARSERFYRQQELEVSEISPDGRNLAVFLYSLEAYQMDSFSRWVKDAFGYGVTVHRTEGHISINLEHEGQSVNVVDTGYGVSQVLPVLAQIWWMRYGQRRARDGSKREGSSIRTLAIEQPELHLHPAHQALLASVFAEAIDIDDEFSARQHFIIETHSEALINKLGELIEEGKLKETDVQIVVFGDRDEFDSSIDVRTSRFDESGSLKNWPFGFFNYN